MADPAYIVDGVLTDGEAWVGLNTATLGSDTATITFKSGFADGDDPAGSGSGGVQNWDQYMDLVLITYARAESGNNVWGYTQIQFNNDTGSNYPYQLLYGDGSSATATYDTPAFWRGGAVGDGAGANEFGVSVVHIFDINSGKYKSGVWQTAADSDGDGYVMLHSATWKNQAAITEIDLSPFNGTNLVAGSRFDLFGVLPRMVA